MCSDCGTDKFLKAVSRYLQMDSAVDTVLRKIQTETAGIGKDCDFRATAMLHAEFSDTFGRKVETASFNLVCYFAEIYMR